MHSHSYNVREENSKKTLSVIIITLITMFAEIFFGYATNSMALLSDGWHMGTHAFALFITFFAYLITKKMENSDLFPNGTDKISVLAGFLSSIFLGITGVLVIIESFSRFFNPLEIGFNTAVLIAVIGLVVNGICLLVMESKNTEKDFNFKAAYLHILTDAMTSIFAIIALVMGKYFGLSFLDPIMGIVGGILILSWAKGLIVDTGAILLDMKPCSKHDKHYEHC